MPKPSNSTRPDDEATVETDLSRNLDRYRRNVTSGFSDALESRQRSLANLYKHLLMAQKEVVTGVIEMIDSEIKLAETMAEPPKPRAERVEIE
jgi:hypothetical protein